MDRNGYNGGTNRLEETVEMKDSDVKKKKARLVHGFAQTIPACLTSAGDNGKKHGGILITGSGNATCGSIPLPSTSNLQRFWQKTLSFCQPSAFSAVILLPL